MMVYLITYPTHCGMVMAVAEVMVVVLRLE